MSGYLVYLLEKKEIFSGKNAIVNVSIAIFLFLIEILIVLKAGLQKSIVVTIFLYLLVCSTLLYLLKNPKPQLENISKKCRILANFTYYSHPFFIWGIKTLADNRYNVKTSSTIIFFVVCLVTFVGGMLIYKVNKEKINKFIV